MIKYIRGKNRIRIQLSGGLKENLMNFVELQTNSKIKLVLMFIASETHNGFL